MLNKEECLNALEILCTYADGNPRSRGEFVGKMLQEADDTLQELIKEHFELVDLLKKHYLENLSIKELDKWFNRSLWHVNKVNELSNKTIELSRDVKSKQEIIDVLTTNPPLKFEELKENMWVWDNQLKEFIKIEEVLKDVNIITYHVFGESILCGGDFEEDIYYRFDVKEELEKLLYFRVFLFT